jgi:phenylpropionate dioxygenase-like ring-hydroxylating dioxygenase large terminal subunit
MIRNQWYVVLESDEVKTQPLGVTRLGEKMVFWRDQVGKVHAAVDRCPHRGVALSVGKIKDSNLQCPFIAVGLPVAWQPPLGSRRADFPHRALQKSSLP